MKNKLKKVIGIFALTLTILTFSHYQSKLTKVTAGTDDPKPKIIIAGTDDPKPKGFTQWISNI